MTPARLAACLALVAFAACGGNGGAGKTGVPPISLRDPPPPSTDPPGSTYETPGPGEDEPPGHASACAPCDLELQCFAGQGSETIYLRTYQGLCVLSESESPDLEYGDPVLGCGGSLTSLTEAGGQSSERGTWSRLPGGELRICESELAEECAVCARVTVLDAGADVVLIIGEPGGLGGTP
jgi:hypothetical protein